ncbi:MAG: helix-turn-helix transcriptional regulator [Acidimicrobiia bacterium]
MSERPSTGGRRRGPRPAQERLRRLLVMLPWIMERGEVPVSEVAARFHLTEAEVVADLERIAMCGVPPYGPDDLVDLFVDDGQVVAGPARFFSRPLRLTAPEAFALLTSARAAQQLPGADPAGALARALDKLAAVVGRDAVTVDLTRPVALDEISAAVEEGRQLRIEYWSAASDEASERVIDPAAVFADRGNWYVVADDHRSGEERTFRVDRIVAVTPTGVVREGTREKPPIARGEAWFAEADGLPRVTLRLQPDAAWIVERYPTDAVEPLPGGGFEVVVPVTSERWLARLLVRAGRSVEVVSPPELAGLGARTARRLLGCYVSTS